MADVAPTHAAVADGARCHLPIADGKANNSIELGFLPTPMLIVSRLPLPEGGGGGR